jgi:putative tricarboxylic transport membrane protein
MTEALLYACGQLFSWPGILYPIAGTAIAMIISFLPGIGMTAVASIFLLLTAYWEVEAALLFFGALVGGATYMGSVTGILFNIPGSTPSAAILLDGYPMGQRGYPKRALAAAATASAVGSIFGVVTLLLLLPIIKPYLLYFGSFEKLLVGLWGLVCIVIFTRGSLTTATVMALFGLLLGLIGVDLETGQHRLNFGVEYLADGIDPIVLLLGIFSLAELYKLRVNRLQDQAMTKYGAVDDSIIGGVLDVLRHRWLTLRSSIIGTIVGIIPGVGGTVASFVSYNFAVQGSKNPEDFGQGDVRGVIAPEAAVDAKDGGSLVPALVLGLPGSEVGIVLISLFAIHGLVPGSVMLTTQLPLSILLIVALLFSNLLTSALGIGLIPLFVRLKNLNFRWLSIPLLILIFYLVYDIRQSYEDIVLLVLFGVFSLLMDRRSWPKVPLIVGFVPGKFIESNSLVTRSLIDINGTVILEKTFTQILLLTFVISAYYFYRTRQFQENKHTYDLNLLGLIFFSVLVCLVELWVSQSKIGFYPLAILGLLIFMAIYLCLMKFKLRRQALDKANK